MKRTYRDRDHSFGQMMLNLRSAIGFTQTGLAEYLGISRFAVGEWEAGNKYPKMERLKAVVELAVQQGAGDGAVAAMGNHQGGVRHHRAVRRAALRLCTEFPLCREMRT